jgi:hypothetical protein
LIVAPALRRIFLAREQEEAVAADGERALATEGNPDG